MIPNKNKIDSKKKIIIINKTTNYLGSKPNQIKIQIMITFYF